MKVKTSAFHYDLLNHFYFHIFIPFLTNLPSEKFFLPQQRVEQHHKT